MSSKCRVQGSDVIKQLFSAVYCMLTVLCCLLSISCASQNVVKHSNNGYKRVLAKWTKDGKVYKDFETKLIIKATFKSEEFRESYVREYSTAFILDEEKTKKLENEEKEAQTKYHEFFVSLHTPNLEWSDLERKEPIWALYLVNDLGERVSPLEVKKVKERSPNVTRFYPQLDDWSAGYTVKFPLSLADEKQLVTQETKYIKLIMAGSPGKAELKWKINR